MDECWLEYGLVKAGYKEARINQRKVIECYTARRDVFFVSPTGSGKSLTFEVAPFVLDKQHNRSGITSHMVLVVSPLVALMRMQTKELRERGIPAVYLGETSDPNNDGGYGLHDIEPRQNQQHVFEGSPHHIMYAGHDAGRAIFSVDYAPEIDGYRQNKSEWLTITGVAVHHSRICHSTST